jgi:hypothetical protein
LVKKKAALIPLNDRKALIDREGADLSICEQCALLSVNRSTLYYTAAQEPSEELEIMRALDELYTEDPSRGVRRMLSCIRAKGHKIGRYKISRRMPKMRLKTFKYQWMAKDARPTTPSLNGSSGLSNTKSSTWKNSMMAIRCTKHAVSLFTTTT